PAPVRLVVAPHQAGVVLEAQSHEEFHRVSAEVPAGRAIPLRRLTYRAAQDLQTTLQSGAFLVACQPGRTPRGPAVVGERVPGGQDGLDRPGIGESRVPGNEEGGCDPVLGEKGEDPAEADRCELPSR